MSIDHPFGHLLHERYVRRVREITERRAAERAKVRTKAQLLRLRADVRRKIRRCFGPLPKRTPLNARTTGVVRRKDYTIENVIYESRPGFPVTASLYIPTKGPGPFPAVLGVCGHSEEGRMCDHYQTFSANLARQGYAVLIYDPISQGERLQYSPRDGQPVPRGCCQEHNMAGNQMSLLGDFFGTWRAWDGIRGLDYLLARPEVDRTRVGLTGNSGGGTMTTWLTALDDRFTMAAPSCFVTQYILNLENEMSQDSEQYPPGLTAAGCDLADFFIAQIPRPTLLLGQEQDYFDVRGLEAIRDELKRLYGILGKADDIKLFVGPRGHGYYVENREAMYRFFNRAAGVRATAREPKGWRPVPLEKLHASPAGQVRTMRGTKRVFDFTAAAARDLAEGRKKLSRPKLLATIAKRLTLPTRSGVPHHRVIPILQENAEGLFRRLAFAVETEPDNLALVHACRPEGYTYCLPRHPKVTLYVPHLSAIDEVRDGQAPAGLPLMAIDVRGFGRLAPETCGAISGFHSLVASGTDHMYAAHSMMLGESLAGARVHDVLCALDLLAGHGCREVHLVGRGLGSIWATVAACLHPLVKRVTLHDALRSFHELTQTPTYRWPLSALPRGVLKDFDLPDCHALLKATRKLRIVNAWDARMRPVRKAR